LREKILADSDWYFSDLTIEGSSDDGVLVSDEKEISVFSRLDLPLQRSFFTELTMAAFA